MALSSFSEATAITPTSSHTYTASLAQSWCIGTVPHGGYVTSCILSCARAHFSTTLVRQSQPDCLTLALTFLRRTSVGLATFTVRDAKIGRQTSTIHVSLSQEQRDGSLREEVVGYLTFCNMSKLQGLSLPTPWSLQPAPYAVDLARLRGGEDPNWAFREDTPFKGFRHASQKVHFHLPREEKGQLELGMVDEWLRMATGERFTTDTLGYVSDMWLQPVELYRDGDEKARAFPEEVEGQEGKKRITWARNWYPTLQLNLEIKKVLPPEGVEWLFVRVKAKQIKNGRLDVEVVILDEGAEIVALSQHVCLIVGSERNMAERKSSKL